MRHGRPGEPRHVLPLLALTALAAACGNGDGLSPEDVEIRLELEVTAVQGEGADATTIPNPTTVLPGDLIAWNLTVTNEGSVAVSLEAFFHETRGTAGSIVGGVRAETGGVVIEAGESLVSSPAGAFTVRADSGFGGLTLVVGVEVPPKGDVATEYEMTVVEP